MSVEEFHSPAIGLQNEFAERVAPVHSLEAMLVRDRQGLSSTWTPLAGAHRHSRMWQHCNYRSDVFDRFRLRMAVDCPHSQYPEGPINRLLTIQPDHA
jgi:hypothetical protein